MKNLILPFIFLVSFSLFSQNQSNLIPQQLKIGELKTMEINTGSKEIKSDVIHVTDDFYKLASPIIFQRENSSFSPSPRLWCFYSNPDSIVRKLNYRWYDAIYKPTDGIKAFDKSRLPKYQDLFDKLTKNVSKELDLKPTESIPKKETNQISRKFWKTVNKWESNKFSIKLTYFYAIQKEGNVSDLFVQLEIEWDDKKAKEVFIQKTKVKQDSIAQEYLSHIFKKDFDACWNMLDVQVQNKTDRNKFDTHMLSIAKLHKKKNPFILFLSGKQMIGFQNINSYNYKRKSDSTPPKLMINLYFLNNRSTKIYGINVQQR